jgi:hypothetical protein
MLHGLAYDIDVSWLCGVQQVQAHGQVEEAVLTCALRRQESSSYGVSNL